MDRNPAKATKSHLTVRLDFIVAASSSFSLDGPTAMVHRAVVSKGNNNDN